MSFETAMQRVGEIRALAGAEPMGSAATATTVDTGAFGAQLAQHQAALAGGGAAASATRPGSADSSFGAYGLPVLTVADQYRQMGITPPTAGIGTGATIPLSGTTAGARMVELAQREVGVAETSANDSSRIREYRAATAGAEGSPGPWCAYFVSWLAKEAGAPVGAGGNGTGYVPTLQAWGKQENRYIEHGTQTPQPGDIAIFDWGHDGVADHTGIVEKVDEDGTVHTIEGNSSDAVKRREYAASSTSITGFVRPG